ncbi:MAG: transporter [Gammaproteobacteria bacterium]|nr:transporter [Gammaproteobacteria bacterium]
MPASALAAGMVIAFAATTTWAHDPIFGIGPHVLYKGGIETAAHLQRDKAGEETENELAFELVYGLTGDWAAGVELPYAGKDDGAESASGAADITLFTKYRFWREDSLGLQESAAVLLVVNLDNGDETQSPPLGNGATDVLAGLTYGYEGLQWYRWASARYLRPGENGAGLQMGEKWLVDVVGGWRPTPPEYRRPDTVWLLELNGEFAQKATRNGDSRPNSGGSEWFLSPGVFWTTHNFAIKAGVQIPIASDLNGTQDESDYRVSASAEWHW